MELDLTKEKDVLILMSSSKNEKEWDSNCDKVKDANKGNYPSFWFGAILMTGLANQVSKSWNKGEN